MASLFRRFLGHCSPSPRRVFSNPNFERITSTCKIEEETFSDYLAARHYPVRIGEVLDSRYQVVGKLGYGAYSTVWVARDLKWVTFLTATHGQVTNPAVNTTQPTPPRCLESLDPVTGNRV